MNKLLPPNATALERRIAQTEASISELPTPICDVWNPDTAPVELLPWLAWAFSVDAWDSAWTENQRRETIKSSVQVHQHKGTFAAIRDALNALGFPIRVQEWYQQDPPGKPYTFKLLIDVDQIGVPNTGALKFMPVVMAAKNLRSHLDTIELRVASTAEVFTAGLATLGNELTLRPGDEQYAQIIPGLAQGDIDLDAITNTGLVAALGIHQ
ncbi:phage tail protein I [Pseudomonas luteola]|uniref:Phage tail protein I n=1 Tax=Pseudomonas luteola TaxID=47886 RepID=A0ABS0N1D1_PSELU|nr:phage tail protein I [Pseudomonas luteola]MBH3441817.1 phage tail protein I [Pseudomonas luteola]